MSTTPIHANPFTPSFEQLPEVLPIFPLPGVLLLPRQVLPLNIFEPRYLSMFGDALGAGRNIGMIQPDGRDRDPPTHPSRRRGRADYCVQRDQ